MFYIVVVIIIYLCMECVNRKKSVVYRYNIKQMYVGCVCGFNLIFFYCRSNNKKKYIFSSWKQRRVQQTSIIESSDWDASSRQVVAELLRIFFVCKNLRKIELSPLARYRVPTFYMNCRNFIPCSWNFFYQQKIGTVFYSDNLLVFVILIFNFFNEWQI